MKVDKPNKRNRFTRKTNGIEIILKNMFDTFDEKPRKKLMTSTSIVHTTDEAKEKAGEESLEQDIWNRHTNDCKSPKAKN